jgi:antitoxin ParD1/3/4
METEENGSEFRGQRGWLSTIEQTWIYYPLITDRRYVMPTSVALSSHFESFIKQQVDSGRYNNASEVVRAGLRLLEDRELHQSVQLQELRSALAAGLASGPGIPAEQVFDRLEAKYQAMVERTS